MADPKQRYVISDLSGGRNAVDAPTSLKPSEVIDAVNVDYWQSRFVHKRFGSTALSTLFSSGGPFTGYLASMYRHVPGTDESLMEEWVVDTNRIVGRWTALNSAKFAIPTYKDAPIGNGYDFSFASLTGKLVQAYNPTGAFTAASAPTVANNGSGTYPAVLRWYRVRWTIISGSTVTSRSPEGTPLSFTPSGTGLQARVTRPALPGLGETHWEVDVSLDNSTWKVLFGEHGVSAAIAAATATADDNFAGTTTIESLTTSTTWTAPNGIVGAVSYLLAGAGAGGGSGHADDDNGAGGGGAGGEVLTGTDTIAAGAAKVVVIGAGGAGSTGQVNGSDGGNSTFNSHTAHGGSGGGWSKSAGTSGTLGGGGGSIGSNAGGTGTKHAGGAGVFVNGGDHSGGGGAGDAAVGSAAGAGPPSTGGTGGAGTASSISGASVTYGTGGAGGTSNTSGTGASGAANTGTGGAGGNENSDGGSGGSGTLVLSYTLLYAGTSASNPQISAAARLHIWDPAASSVRRTGIAPGSSQPTVANTGGGAYAATARIYRIRFTEQQGGITVRRSEPTPNATSFTPSGGGTAARVTMPTAPNEGETHWELEASFDGGSTFSVNPTTTVIGTTTFDDSSTQAQWAAFTVSTALGTYSLQKPYKFICAGENRVIGFSTYDLTAKQHRVEWSAVNGSINIGDIERVDTTLPYYYDLDEHDSGIPTGIVGPMNGDYFPFKSRQIWQMHPTGDVNRPFAFTPISKTVGSVSARAISIGEDAYGRACLYFMSHVGAYQYGVNGLVYIGKGIEDLILGPTAYLNLDASQVIAHAVYHADKGQWWVWHATNTLPKTAGDASPTRLSIYHVKTGGWTRFTGKIATALCSCLLPQQMDSTRVTRDLKPAMGSSATTNYQLSCDQPLAAADDGTNIQAFVTTRPIEPGGPGFLGTVGDALLLAAPVSGAQITVTAAGDFGRTSSPASVVSLTATSDEASASRVSRRFDTSSLGDVEFVSYTIGDGAASATMWRLDQLVVNYQKNGAKAA